MAIHEYAYIKSYHMDKSNWGQLLYEAYKLKVSYDYILLHTS